MMSSRPGVARVTNESQLVAVYDQRIENFGLEPCAPVNGMRTRSSLVH